MTTEVLHTPWVWHQGDNHGHLRIELAEDFDWSSHGSAVYAREHQPGQPTTRIETLEIVGRDSFEAAPDCFALYLNGTESMEIGELVIRGFRRSGLYAKGAVDLGIGLLRGSDCWQLAQFDGIDSTLGTYTRGLRIEAARCGDTWGDPTDPQLDENLYRPGSRRGGDMLTFAGVEDLVLGSAEDPLKQIMCRGETFTPLKMSSGTTARVYNYFGGAFPVQGYTYYDDGPPGSGSNHERYYTQEPAQVEVTRSHIHKAIAGAAQGGSHAVLVSAGARVWYDECLFSKVLRPEDENPGARQTIMQVTQNSTVDLRDCVFMGPCDFGIDVRSGTYPQTEVTLLGDCAFKAIEQPVVVV